ncbi:HlyD family type I secretion periplasmic adaptor subunit [Methylophilus aquaticus]|uniref:Membrane fusion protein (MFP) family protein n=1 Tax=Methylophilus aquaticus TaxID=1971610 RepID=A0ABT9JST8_9PROT|nr:HlyD family type I secretion periplasmic adaptor subunit [Methylophilus aquaticus]MDP8567191.1 HlyD family type I secretion periplasmic adaptor subunit [Methylophilus aquaticus]
MAKKLFEKFGNITERESFWGRLGKPVTMLVDKLVKTETAENRNWTEQAHDLMVAQSMLHAKVVIYTMIGIMLVLLVWANFAKVDEVTRGEGRVIPSRQIQVVQSLDGGIVTDIMVKLGDTVKRGQPLIKIDETRAISSLKENESQFLSLKAKEARLKALANGDSFNPPDEVQQKVPETYLQELQLFNNGREELNSQVNIARDQLSQRERELSEVQFKKEVAIKTYESNMKELAANRPLLSSGAVSEIEILRLEREANRAKGDIDQASAQLGRLTSAISEARRKISEAQQSFLSKVRTDLNETTAKINSLSQSSLALSDKVKQSTLLSPVNGKISKLYFNTVGGVIQPGKEVMEVVPSDDSLVIEAKVQTKDIAFIRPQQPAIIKLTAYDYTIYGSLDGVVEDIAADSTIDDKGNAFYVVKIKTVKNNLGEHLPIIPGMVAQVDVLTGKKTVLSYLLKPVLKAKSYALTER